MNPHDPHAGDEASTIEDGRPDTSATRKIDDLSEIPRSFLVQGESVGRYIILGRLGEGGMGVVYAAYDPELDRKVAIKLLSAARLHADPKGQARLLREARAMAQLNHPNVVAVHDVGTASVGSGKEQIFLAMELIEGTTLKAWCAQKPRTWREIRDAFLQVGHGLAAAHAAHLIHRDIKPSNVLVGKDGRIRVTDFGIVRRAADGDENADLEAAGIEPGYSSSPGSLTQPLTREGQVVGSLPYMAPEQIRGGASDERSDQFSYCLAFYEALYGERPYTRRSLTTPGVAPTEPPKDSRVPAWLRKIVVRGMSSDPAARYPSMAALLAELDRDPAITRRRWLVAAAGTLVVAALGSAVAIGSTSDAKSAVCTGGPTRLAAAWSPERARAIERAFLATGKPYAKAAAARVIDALDRYGKDWVAMYTGACAATKVTGEQSASLLDLRMVCLGERLEELDAQVRLFAQADAALVTRGAQATASLSPLGTCSNAKALTAPVKPPRDEGASAEVEAMRKKLARVKALENAAQYDEALEIATAVTTTSESLGYRPLEAEALIRKGWLETQAGSYQDAEQTLRAAIVAAVAGHHDRVAADAWSKSVYVAYRRGQIERAYAFGDYARAAIERLGGDDRLRASLASYLGNAFARAGREAEAIAEYRRALALENKLDHPRPIKLAVYLNNLATVLANQGNYEEALATHQRALALWKANLGADHPKVATSLSNIASVLLSQGRYDEARGHLKRSLDISRRTRSPDHPFLAYGLGNLGVVLSQQGEYERAQKVLSRALALREQAFGENHPKLPFPLANLGHVLAKQGQYKKARAHLERALAIQEQSLGPSHPNLSMSLVYLGELAHLEGNSREARAHLWRAVKLLEEGRGPTNVQLTLPLRLLGDVALARGEAAEALKLYRRALTILKAETGKKNPDLAWSLTGIGRAELALGRPDQALAPLTEALALRENNKSDARDLAIIRAALAAAKRAR